jgi:hypothetical protein
MPNELRAGEQAIDELIVGVGRLVDLEVVDLTQTLRANG